VNYCVKALVQKGWIKARNFKNSNNKLAYTYYLTPRGIEEKTQLAIEFLKVKLREVKALREEIHEIHRQARRDRSSADDALATE
jgi:EPS-associated MarR family transcriptional regulator